LNYFKKINQIFCRIKSLIGNAISLRRNPIREPEKYYSGNYISKPVNIKFSSTEAFFIEKDKES